MQSSKTTSSVLEYEWARAEDLEARKVKEEAERKAREEVDRKVREETERKAREEAERKAKEEAAMAAPPLADAKTQQAIQNIADQYGQLCRGGFAWKKTATGYVCQGDTHSLTFEQLGMRGKRPPYEEIS